MDLNNDGKPDILSGSWPGELYFFEGLGKGKFAKGVQLLDKDGTALKLGQATTAFAFDWNGDGLLDLLVGDLDGSVQLVINGGTAKQYAFGKVTKLEAGGKAIAIRGGHTAPIAVDWDGDQLADLIVGCDDGSVKLFKNTGAAKQPQLAGPETLISAPDPRANPVIKGIKRGGRVKPGAFDWNGDGKPDLLIGDFYHPGANAGKQGLSGYVWLFLRK